MSTDRRVCGPVAKLGLALAAYACVVGARAQPPAAPAPEPAPAALGEVEIAAVVASLQSPDFRERDRTTRELVLDDRFSLPALERLLIERGPAMSPEGRERLMAIARDRFNRSPRGAMGISFGGRIDPQVNLNDRVVVGQTYAGFESHRLLETADIVTHADGHELRGPDAQIRMQSIIVSHDPGDAIPLVVRRGAQKLRISVRLRAFTDLPNSVLDPGRLARAWRYRSRLYAPAAAEPIRLDTTPAEWDNDRRDPQFGFTRAQRRTPRNTDSRLPGVAGGGTPRVVLADPDDPRLNRLAQMNMPIAARRAFQFAMVQGMDELRTRPMTTVEELREVSQARSRAVANQRADDPDGMARVMLIDKLADAIRADAAERGESIPDIVVEPAAPGEGDQ